MDSPARAKPPESAADRFYGRIRKSLAGAEKIAAPLPPALTPAPSDPVAAFRFALERAGGRCLDFASEAEARAAFSGDDDPDGETGVDRADLLLADTGTVVRSYESREASRVSLVPPRSVFLARQEMIVAGLPEALDRVAGLHRAGRAYTVLITGPSRTADVEKQLVIPAHGPRELIVALIHDSPDSPRQPDTPDPKEPV